MTMTTAPNVNAVRSMSPDSGPRLQLPVVSGSLQIRAPAARARLDEPRSPHDVGHSDRSEDDDGELSPQSAAAADSRSSARTRAHSTHSTRDAAGSDADLASDAGLTSSPTPADVAVKRGAWSPQEDEQLVHLVETMRPLKWVHVSAYMKTRTSKQCRERYHNYLKPSLNRAPISKEEGRKIEELVAIHGKRWAEISRQLPGRSDNAIKNWWNASVTRRRASQDTSAVLLQSSQTPSPAQQQRQSQHHLQVPSPAHAHAPGSDDSDASSRASASPPAPPPVAVMFNQQYMDAASRSSVAPAVSGTAVSGAAQARSGPQRTRSVTAHTTTLPYPPTTPRWTDTRSRLSVGSITSIGSRSNSIVDDNGRSVSPSASPPSLLPSARPGAPDDGPMGGLWNRRLPEYRRPSDVLRADVTSLSQYSLSSASNPTSRRSSLNPAVPAELARPHGQLPLELAPHLVQQSSLQQALQPPLVQLQPVSASVHTPIPVAGLSPTEVLPSAADSKVAHDTAALESLQQQQKQAQLAQPAQQTPATSPSASPGRNGNEAEQPQFQQPQNNRSSLARLSIANLTNPIPE